MTAKEFLFEKLAQIAEAFPHITIKYEYNELDRDHIVELTPVEEYYNNTQLDEAWLKLVPIFFEKFPTEDVTFISSDSSFGVDKPEFVFNDSNLLAVAPD